MSRLPQTAIESKGWIRKSLCNRLIRLLNMSENLRDVFAISTGTSGQKHLIEIYEKTIKSFKGKGKYCPIILLVDNDDGSKEIKKKVSDKTLSNSSFCHYVENLYILFAPKRKNKEIEDLFDRKTLNTKVDGKKFSREKKIDPTREYGKYIFAEKVIKAKQNEINFDGFKEIFDNFKLIIEDYGKKVNPKK